MPVLCKIELLETFSQLFEIVTPLILFAWFFHSRWLKMKSEYFDEIAGHYGGFITDTVNPSTDEIRYDGSIIMEMLTMDVKGYFRGEFQYSEDEVKLGYVGGPPAKTNTVLSSINFCTGQVRFRWSFKFWKKRHPLLWNTNRIYLGKMHIVHRLDLLIEKESEALQSIYTIIHHRESGVMEFKEVNRNNPPVRLPKYFILTKSINHALDPYNNIKRIAERNRRLR